MGILDNDLINGDVLIEEEEIHGDEPSEEVTPERRRIFTDKLDPPVGSLHEKQKSGDLVLDPIFQRRKVWDETRSSRLVESVILEVPLPVFYFAESQDGTQEVIDGQQRLWAFFFLDNEYALKGLTARTELIGRRFKDLDKASQRQIRDYALRTVVFKKESDENLRFEIFERLNTGAVPLNDQELRNCVYHGSYNKLLIELSGDADYMWLMGLKAPEKRMRDVEYVLRFSAFYHATYLKYKPSMSRFLNEDMKACRSISTKQAAELRSAFKTAVTLVRSLLGENACHRYRRGDSKSPNGYWEPRKFNSSLFDILMYSMAHKDKNQVMRNLDAIREAFVFLMTEDDDFIESIELSTSAQKMVLRRFDKWRIALDQVLETDTREPRCFSRTLKEQLYFSNKACAICGQHIADVDDAAVDHIEQYWLGGRTIPENARLTHRFCNWSRSRKESLC
jgi:hypothetical protein